MSVELEHYIKRSIHLGHSLEHISEQLLAVGWQMEEFEHLIGVHGGDHDRQKGLVGATQKRVMLYGFLSLCCVSVAVLYVVLRFYLYSGR